MGWEPMSPEDAERFLDAWPPGGTTSADRFAKFVEALSVSQGATKDEVRTAVEKILGHPIE